MSIMENDPRITGYIALLRAITWYEQIDSESAIRIANGQSNRRPGQKLTSELLQEIKKNIDSPNYKNINAAVKKFRVNKYDIYQALSGDENANEEAIIMPKIESLLKSLKDKTENCVGKCDECAMDSVKYGDITLCEIFCWLEFKNGKLVPQENSVVHKCAQMCTSELLTGETMSKGIRVYKAVSEKVDSYISNHPKERLQDFFSIALLEYIENHK